MARWFYHDGNRVTEEEVLAVSFNVMIAGDVKDFVRKVTQVLGSKNPVELVVRKRVSKPLKAYTRETLNVAVLCRYREHGIDKRPGQDVRYVVVDDGARRTPEGVRLSFEVDDDYDPSFYGSELLRACESVIAPLGWDRNELRRYLRNHRDIGLAAFE